MSKSKTKELTVTESKIEVDPRVRMKEIRQQVKKAVNDGQRVDLIAFNNADKARAMIALQDLLDHESKAHNKASNHIHNLKNKLTALSSVVLLNITASMSSRKASADRFEQLIEMFAAADSKCVELSQENQELSEMLDEKHMKLDGALTTIKTLMDGN